MGKLAVIAVGGNALIHDKNHQTVKDQFHCADETMKRIADVVKRGYDVVVTHGNGPQVGFILFRSDYARDKIHQVPLDSCVADTQGSIGYNFQMALNDAFRRRKIDEPVVTIVTQVLVDKDDLAFKKPSKPIGRFYTKEEADTRKKIDGWDVMEDAGRGWRRVVPSPEPLEIIELEVIKRLLAAGVVVIAVGGGGIPVTRDKDGDLMGVEAVIDKDLASSLLASDLGADIFVIMTSVKKVCLNFGKPDEKAIDKMTVAEVKKYIEEGHFKPGSMLPKMKAVVSFLENGGREALITDPSHLEDAMDGKTGTRIVR